MPWCLCLFVFCCFFVVFVAVVAVRTRESLLPDLISSMPPSEGKKENVIVSVAREAFLVDLKEKLTRYSQ